MQEMAREYGVALIGGDTVGAPQGLMLSLTVLGRVRPSELLRRDQAQEGDLIYVTGPLGQAAAGLEILRRGLELPEETKKPLLQAFLDPRPEVAAGRLLARNHLATSLIDLSDGVASDLYQICLRSQVGAVVEAERVPITPAVKEVAVITGKNPLDLALQGGEDYYLLFTGAPDKRLEMRRCFAQANLSEPWCVGKIVSGSGVKLRTKTGEEEISGTGFDHFPEAKL
jgi:thiamine-monophosphate kinase